jgi:nucleoside-diphosphate-sugar epimerase
MASKHAVVIGALGVIGRALIDRLTSDPQWDVVGLSRRPPDFDTSARFISVDLSDRDSARATLAELDQTTHVFYAAYQSLPDRGQELVANLALLANSIDALAAASGQLQHVNLTEGGKWYGFHLGPAPMPAVEDDRRHMPPNFYYAQQDWLEAASARQGFTWSALRPEAVCGFAVGNPMNLAMAIAVYAAICAELDVPFSFPGRPGAWTAISEMTDARLLAHAAEWAATTPRCAGEAFNITNGDVFRWRNLWPKLAQRFGVEHGEPRHLCLAEFMADKGPVWDRIVAEHGLHPYPYDQIVSWQFADATLGIEWDVICSTLKARRYGFNACIETDRMFGELYAELARRQIIPATATSPSVEREPVMD